MLLCDVILDRDTQALALLSIFFLLWFYVYTYAQHYTLTRRCVSMVLWFMVGGLWLGVGGMMRGDK